MDLEIIIKDLRLEIYGFGGIATNKDYAGTAFKLSSKMWQVVKANNLKNKGKNIWVYETGDRVFAGVELESDTAANNDYGLEKYTISLEKYAYFRHVGGYNQIKQRGQEMTSELAQ